MEAAVLAARKEESKVEELTRQVITLALLNPTY
jgi:hypothetical protein